MACGVGLLPNEGLALLAQYLLGKLPFPSGGWQLMLYVNAVIPTQVTVLADLTEASFTGYLRTTLSPGTWTTPTVIVDRVVSSYGTMPIVWTNSGATTQTIYGWAIVDPVAGKLEMVQSLDTCDQFTITPGAMFSLLPYFYLTTTGC